MRKRAARELTIPRVGRVLEKFVLILEMRFLGPKHGSIVDSPQIPKHGGDSLNRNMDIVSFSGRRSWPDLGPPTVYKSCAGDL
jgi:hypothetical protein